MATVPTAQDITHAIAQALAGLYQTPEEPAPVPEGPKVLVVPPFPGCSKHPQPFSGWILNECKNHAQCNLDNNVMHTYTRAGAHLRTPEALIKLTERLINARLVFSAKIKTSDIDMEVKGSRTKLSKRMRESVTEWLGDFGKDRAEYLRDAPMEEVGKSLKQWAAEGQILTSVTWEAFAFWDIIPTESLKHFVWQFFICDEVEQGWLDDYENAKRKGKALATIPANPAAVSDISSATAATVG